MTGTHALIPIRPATLRKRMAVPVQLSTLGQGEERLAAGLGKTKAGRRESKRSSKPPQEDWWRGAGLTQYDGKRIRFNLGFHDGIHAGIRVVLSEK